MGTPLIVIPLTIGIAGFFKLEAFKGIAIVDADGVWRGRVHEFKGSRRKLTGWMPNQILDAGRNIMATSSNWAGVGSKCQVGTNSTTPLATDTQLLGYVAGTATQQAHSSGAQSSSPYFGWDLMTYRFGVGAAEGILSEAGVGWSTADGPYLISRALIVDGGGTPTSVTVLANEFLDVTYQLRYYPPLGDTLETVTLNGVSYDLISRASAVTSWGGNIGQAIGQRSLTNSDWQAYDGDVGTIVQAPSGVSAQCDNANQFNQSYSNNSYRIDMQCDTGSTGWNLGAGIRSIRIKTNAGDFQTQFNATSGGARVPKDTNFTMELVWRLGWTAAVIP